MTAVAFVVGYLLIGLFCAGLCRRQGRVLHKAVQEISAHTGLEERLVHDVFLLLIVFIWAPAMAVSATKKRRAP